MLRSRATLAGVTSAAVSFFGAWGYVALADGFGASDLAPFAIWCVLLAAFVAAFTAAVMRFDLPSRRLPRVALAIVLGLPAGLVFTFAVALGLGPWIGAFSFPVLYLWATGAAVGLSVGLWSTTMHSSQRPSVFWALAGIGAVLATVIFLPGILILGSVLVWNRAESEVHLIPEGFRGPVVIVFDQATGAAPEREGNARVYRIPSDGVLRTQLPPNNGWSAPDYFYLNPAGRRAPIVAGSPCTDSLPSDPPQACLMGQMYISGRSGPAYKAYVVAHRDDRAAGFARGDSLVRAVVYGEVREAAP